MGALINLTLRGQPGEGGAQDPITCQFDQDEVLVGRDEAMDVQLPHPSVSLMHLRLFRRGAALYAEDLGSTNGVLVDGVPLAPRRPRLLDSSARLAVGCFEISLGTSPTGERQAAPEDTAALARQMVLGMLGDHSGGCPCHLEVCNGAQQGARLEVPLLTPPLVIGRGAGCDLELRDADASRRHVELRRDGQGVVARDLGSKNGFQINGEVVRSGRALRHGDELILGQTRLLFRHTAAGGAGQPGPEEPAASRAGAPHGRGEAAAIHAAQPAAPPSPGEAAALPEAEASVAGESRRLLVLSIAVGALVLLALVALITLLG